MLEGWQRIDNRDLRVRVPRTTDAGPVFLERGGRDGAERIHARTEDRHTVYFETVSFAERIEHASAIEAHRAFIVEQFDGARLSDVKTGRVANREATMFRFDADNFARTFVHLDVGDHTYRVVFDHDWPLNLEVLRTLRFAVT